MGIEGRDKPLLVDLQTFCDGQPACNTILNHGLQLKVVENLGRHLSRLNQITVDGFGDKFDPVHGKFTKEWPECLAEMRIESKIQSLVELGIITRVEGLKLESALQPLKSLSPRSVLCHCDTNPGNYLHNDAGKVTSLIDWDTAEGAPWQREVAIGLGKIQASTYYIPAQERKERANAFLSGYANTEELRTLVETNMPVIEAFKLAGAIGFVEAIVAKYKWPHSPGAYLSVEDDTYLQRHPDKSADKQDFGLMFLGSEAIMREFL